MTGLSVSQDTNKAYSTVLPYKLLAFSINAANQSTLFHWQENVELIFCASGSIEVSSSNHSFRLIENDFILIQSNMVHSIYSRDIGECLLMEFSPTLLESLSENDFLDTAKYNLAPQKANKSIRRLVDSIRHTLIQDYFSNEFLATKVFDILSLLYNYRHMPILDSASIKSIPFKSQQKRINDYLFQNYENHLTIKDVAEYFGYNPSYFSRMFKKNTGVTFSDYLRSIRLQAAFRQLKHTDMTILEIALTNGFSSKSFNQAFKKHYRLSPYQYRKKYLT